MFVFKSFLYAHLCAHSCENFGLSSAGVNKAFAAESRCIFTHFVKKYELREVFAVTP